MNVDTNIQILKDNISRLPRELVDIIWGKYWKNYWDQYVYLELKTLINTRLIYNLDGDNNCYVEPEDRTAEHYYGEFMHIDITSDTVNNDYDQKNVHKYYTYLDEMPNKILLPLMIYQTQNITPNDFLNTQGYVRAINNHEYKQVYSRPIGREPDTQQELDIKWVNYNSPITKYEKYVNESYIKRRRLMGIRKLVYTQDEYIALWYDLGRCHDASRYRKVADDYFKKAHLGYRGEYVF